MEKKHISKASSEATKTLHELIRYQVEGVEETDPEDFRQRIEALLAGGADLNVPALDWEGEAAFPMAMASVEGSFRWVSFLLELGAKPHLELPKKFSERVESARLPFTPLVRALDGLGYDLEADRGRSLADLGRGYVGVIRALLQAGAPVLAEDPCQHVHALAYWAKNVRQMLRGSSFSEKQISAVVEVTNLLMGSLDPKVASEFREGVLLGDPKVEEDATREMLKWPERVLGAWTSSLLADEMEIRIGEASGLDSGSSGFSSIPVNKRPGRM